MYKRQTENKKRWYAVKFLENDSKVVESTPLSASGKSIVENARKAIEEAHDDDMESIVTDERYKFIQKVVGTAVKKSGEKLTVSDKIDQIVTNRFLGIPIFMLSLIHILMATLWYYRLLCLTFLEIWEGSRC